VDIQALDADARLAAQHEQVRKERWRNLIRVRIGQDYRGVIPAEFQRHPLQSC
jgi:hypothetical protein